MVVGRDAQGVIDGRVQIGDTFWHVHADADLAQGARVKVIGADTMQLKVAAV